MMNFIAEDIQHVNRVDIGGLQARDVRGRAGDGVVRAGQHEQRGFFDAQVLEDRGDLAGLGAVRAILSRTIISPSSTLEVRAPLSARRRTFLGTFTT